MKTKILILAGTFALMLLCIPKAFSTTSLATVDKTIRTELSVEAASSSNFIKIFKAKLADKMTKERFFTKKGTGTKDPLKKWLWLWVGGWILGIGTYMVSALIATGTITIITYGGLVGLIIIFLGSASLKIWIFKKISQLSKSA